MKFKKKHSSNEENFWLSATDMMAGILTVILLMLMLFVLYLNQSKDEVFTPLDATQYIGNETRQDYPAATGINMTIHETIPVQGYGASEVPTQKPTEPPTEPPQPGSQDDDVDKAAVFVTVVDADTGNTIKKKGIEFELYAEKNGIGGLQMLHTYYPKKIEYKKYETTEQGTFYLPEKVTGGWYSLHNTVAPKGYYTKNFTDFNIDDCYDWHEPYMVTVKLQPVKSTIRISVKDPDIGEPVEKVKYEIIASENISSADGTARYRKGKVVDRIETDEEGNAESKELFLGKYHLKQISAPEYYSVSTEAVKVTVSDPSDTVKKKVVQIDCRKTAVTVAVTDKRTAEPIRGVTYSMEGGKKKLVTDEHGQIVISDLKKKSSYTLKLESLPEGYRAERKELSFTVDGDGLVNGKSSAVIDETVYTLTLSVSAKEKVFSRAIAAVDMELLDEKGKVVDSWTSNKEPHIISGMKEGIYYLQKLGEEDTRVEVEIKDTAELQSAALYLWDVFDLFVLLIALGVIALAVLITGLTISQKKKVKRNHE